MQVGRGIQNILCFGGLPELISEEKESSLYTKLATDIV
jgi:hypothetical protein